MNWFQVKSFFDYWRNASTIYDIHSPFLYDFIQFVYDEDRTYYDFRLLETVRKKLEKHAVQFPISDEGATSKINRNKLYVKDIFNKISSPPKISRELYRMNVYSRAHHVLELGTCLGINSQYLARSCKGNLHTIEGHLPFIEYAKFQFRETGMDNIHLHEGRFEKCLLNMKDVHFDLIYLDGDHTYSATMKYVDRLYPLLSENGILVIADIHWSFGMKKAWKEIYQQDRFQLSLDRFDYGILWKNGYEGQKRHIVFTPHAWSKPWKLHKAI